MLRDNCVFIAIGQCGANIVRELELNDFQCFYVNSSLEDLDTIETDYSKKYHISGTKGMAKDRNYAKSIITSDDNDALIAETIYKKYANARMYFFVFSASGGSGGGMANTIMATMKEFYPDKTLNAIVVKPHSEEDMAMQSNAFQCISEIKANLESGVITNLQILDNDKRDFQKKFAINKEITSILQTIMSYQEITTDGNLDEEEMELLFTTKGLTVMYEFDNKDFANDLAKSEESSIYAKYFKDAKIHGLILNKDQNNSINRNIIRETFGVPIKTLDTTWNEETNIIIASGLSFNDEVLYDLKQNYQILKLKKEEIEAQMKKVKDLDLTLDFEEVNATGVSTITSPQRPSTRRRGRGVGVKAEMDRYSK